MINSLNSYVNSLNNVANNGNVKSENIDGYSVQYISSGEISDMVKSKNDEIEDIIKTYLLGVIVNGEHIMYCGV